MSASTLQKRMQAAGLPPMPIINTDSSRSNAKSRRKDFSPLNWEEFYDQKDSVQIGEGESFNVYRKGNTGLLLLLLHGGGYSGLTWSCFTEEVFRILDCQVMAIDFRGHGDTKTEDETDFSAEILTRDTVEVFQKVFDGAETPPVLIIGHSMGGAIAVRVAKELNNVVGLVVIDVVEGSAMSALEGMHQFLRGRPNTFSSVKHAIEWCIKSGTVRNLKSARVSMPGQIIQVSGSSQSSIEPAPSSSTGSKDVVLEEEEESSKIVSEAPKIANSPPEQSEFKVPLSVYTWRIDLTKTGQYWAGWFKDLSKLFLSVPAPKLLLLAGVDRLDKDLTVGQMQGKFQTVVLPKVGHALHEDSPTRVAEAIATFCTRNRLASTKTSFEPVYPGC